MARAGPQHNTGLRGVGSLINPLSIFDCLDPHTVQAYNAFTVQKTKLLRLDVAATVSWSCLRWRSLR